jgi:hypothetical protein
VISDGSRGAPNLLHPTQKREKLLLFTSSHHPSTKRSNRNYIFDYKIIIQKESNIIMAILDNTHNNLVKKMPSLKKHKLVPQKEMRYRPGMRRAISMDAAKSLFYLSKTDQSQLTNVSASCQTPKKNVTFKPTITVYHIPTPDTEEVSQRWYDVTDYRLFEANRKTDVVIMQWAYENSRILDPDQYTNVGLEAYTSRSHFHQRKYRMMHHTFAVLHAQSFQNYKRIYGEISVPKPYETKSLTPESEKNQYSSSWQGYFDSHEKLATAPHEKLTTTRAQ